MTLSETDLVEVLNMGVCPDCLHRGFVLGPRGGGSINIECADLKCRARFNVAQGLHTHKIVMAQRIPREKDGGMPW
jgi:hypothetical protein